MRAYRTTLLLCAFVVLGWLWDFSLGGGAEHAIGWLAALVAVGGVSGLSAWSKQRRGEVAPIRNVQAETGQAPVEDRTVRPARPDELAGLIDVEIAADRL